MGPDPKDMLGLLAISVLFSTQAKAEQYRLTFSAEISKIRSLDENSNEISLPSSVGVGDTISISTLLDTSLFVLQTAYSSVPNINVYYRNVFEGTYNIGGYSYTTATGGKDSSALQLWDNRFVSAAFPSVDSFNLSIATNLSGAPLPVDLGAGPVSLIMSVQFLDFTALVRTSDLISEITPFDLFGNQSANFTFSNSSTKTQTTYTTSAIQASLDKVSAVPEPATWAMMIAGFGLVGGALRGRKKGMAFA